MDLQNIIWTLTIDNNNRYFKKYLDLIEHTIKEDSKILDRRVKELKDVKPVFDEQTGWYDPGDELADMAYELEEMEQLMYRTFVIGAFIFMESQINNLCGQVKKLHNQKFSYKDLRGTGINRSINYLKKALEISFPTNDRTSREFELARIIRNALVHSEGEIDENNILMVNSYIEEFPNRLKWDHKRIVITHEYAISLIELNKKICLEVENHNKVKDF